VRVRESADMQARVRERGGELAKPPGCRKGESQAMMLADSPARTEPQASRPNGLRAVEGHRACGVACGVLHAAVLVAHCGRGGVGRA
jgi:hypothetical protein